MNPQQQQHKPKQEDPQFVFWINDKEGLAWDDLLEMEEPQYQYCHYQISCKPEYAEKLRALDIQRVKLYPKLITMHRAKLGFWYNEHDMCWRYDLLDHHFETLDEMKKYEDIDEVYKRFCGWLYTLPESRVKDSQDARMEDFMKCHNNKFDKKRAIGCIVFPWIALGLTWLMFGLSEKCAISN
jgi:hypothetical protein